VCRSKHVEPSINFGIINSITKLHLVGISTESSSTMHGSMNIKNMTVVKQKLVSDLAVHGRATNMSVPNNIFSHPILEI